MDDRAFTVSGLNEYVERLLSRDVFLSRLQVVGEISGYRRHSSGHAYFLLKDQDSAVRCVMFRQHALEMDFEIENGISVTVSGYASLYVRDGSFQIYVQKIQPQGQGALYEAFERIKQELMALGYFDAERKRALPAFARRIGVVTSESGAVIHDIITVARRRMPGVEILLCPVAVQGEFAAEQIARGIELLSHMDGIDVLIIGRGGGSMEDLWAFNDMMVAQAIFESPIPVISAVGHETDFTIADFVADVRAATPSAAAELTVPSCDALQQGLSHWRLKLRTEALRVVDKKRGQNSIIQAELLRLHPERKMQTLRFELLRCRERMDDAVQGAGNKQKQRIQTCLQVLKDMDPRKVLNRGYALVQDAQGGHIIYSADFLSAGQRIVLHMNKGAARAQITDIGGEDARI